MIDSSNGGGPVGRRGFFARLGAWWRDRRLTGREVSERRTSETPLVVPADGGVFSFTVHHEITYSTRGMSQAQLIARVAEYHTSAVSTVFSRIWPVGREYLPHRPEDAEHAMNAAVGRAWCYDDDVISCRAVVRVTADERVLIKQLPMWERLVTMDITQRVQLHRINQVHELLTGWMLLFRHFGDTPLVIETAALADPQVADAVKRLAASRQAMATELTAVLREARDAHSYVGLYELAEAYDAALRSFERRAGLGRVRPDHASEVDDLGDLVAPSAVDT